MAGGSNNVARMSPRQRMINLMYFVLTAMLALNVSSDVLNGFSLVQEGLHRTNKNMTLKNEVQFRYLTSLYEQNPTKAGPWYQQGLELHDRSNKLYNEIESLKKLIAQKADGPNGDPNKIVNQDNLEAASTTMLNPMSNRGKKLREQIEAYRNFILPLIPDPDKKKAVDEMLSLKVTPPPGTVGPVAWETRMFDNMPVVAAITLLTKLQNDIRQAESEAMGNLISSIDMGDIRVNKLSAYVIPKSNMIIRGGKYSANIVLAAIDTTQRPVIYVGGQRINNADGLYEFVPGAVGTHEFSGYIEVMRADGSIDKQPFKSSYTVIEPMATISPTMMNVLYAGIDNPISISVPGVPMTSVQATMTNGSLTRNGDNWVARATNVGGEATISVSAELEGRMQNVGSMTFRIRKLPDPDPFIPVSGGHYKGTPRRISKAALMGADGIGAAVDDGLLNITYTVISFRTVFFDSMGNAMPEVSNGSHFSERQKEQFKRLKPGKSFFISSIKAKGPDGITRDISPMEVGLN